MFKAFANYLYLRNHEIQAYKTRMNCGILCINVFEIHKPVPLQFKLLSYVFIFTVLKTNKCH